MLPFTETDFAKMRALFESGSTRSYQFRKNNLRLLRTAIQQYESKIMDALLKDLHKSKEETFSTEIGFLYAEIAHMLKNLKQYMRPSSVSTPAVLFPSKSKILKDPLGICLIIAPWNYPFQLLIAPLIGAIAAGNCAVLKPSEITVNTSAVIAEMLSAHFDRNYLAVVEGEGALVVPDLINKHHFDHVFFTGSIPVGKEIAKMAAEKLIPVTLELGGKSPCIVDEDANVEVAARRITWGKFTNAGQTCVAPDYLIVHEKIKSILLEAIKSEMIRFYGRDPQRSGDYGRIISISRFDKLIGYLKQGNIIAGGTSQKDELYIAPTLMDEIAVNSTLLTEEIFGPILPVLTFNKSEDVLKLIAQNPNPLSLYYFGNSKKNEKLFIERLPFGGGCINNTLVHLGNPDLPFGGVGNSGIGAYHGKFSFETFARSKAVLKTSSWFDPRVKYPPYAGKLRFLKWLFK